jgi:hypothetical protein
MIIRAVVFGGYTNYPTAMQVISTLGSVGPVFYSTVRGGFNAWVFVADGHCVEIVEASIPGTFLADFPQAVALPENMSIQ